MKENAKEKGITLVALVVTIIVLLILAGVSLSLVLGDNGIITRAQDAVNKNDEATAREQVAMAWAGVVTDGLATGKIEAENVNKYLSDSAGVDYDNERGRGTVIYDGFLFDVDKDGTVELSGQIAEGKALFTQAVKNGQVKIGDYVDYSPDKSGGVGQTKSFEVEGTTVELKTLSDKTYTSLQSVNGYGNQTIEQEDLKWRVLSKDEKTGDVLLVSATPTRRSFILEGSVGWLNAEIELNNICENLYSGIKGKARSLDLYDINRAVGYTPVLNEKETVSGIYYPDEDGRLTYVTDNGEMIDHLSIGKYRQEAIMSPYAYDLDDYDADIAQILLGPHDDWYYESFLSDSSFHQEKWYSSWLATRCVTVGGDVAHFSVKNLCGNSSRSFDINLGIRCFL